MYETIMDNSLKHLIEKFLRKECTPDEARTVLLWMQDKKNTPEVERWMDTFWQDIVDGKFDPVAYEENWTNLETDLRSLPIPKKVRPLLFIRMALVAAVVTMVFAAGALFMGGEEKNHIETADTPVNNRQNLTKAAKKGEKNTFFLTDGTKIILNSDSRLDIDKEYGIFSRTVYLEGEAYFEVVPNDTLPFQVFSGDLVTTALGTAFNVRYSKTNESVAVSLTSGKVAVELKADNHKVETTQTLNPGEEALYHKSGKELEKRNFDVRKVTGWKDGVMILDEANIDVVRETLENWYDVRIEYTNHPEVDWTFSGEFRNESLNDVLKGLQYSKGIGYKIKNDKVIIRF